MLNSDDMLQTNETPNTISGFIHTTAEKTASSQLKGEPFFSSDHEPENLGRSRARHTYRPLQAKPHRLPCCYESTRKDPPLEEQFI